MFSLTGLGFAWKATTYEMGTAAHMGPGYFPFWLGVCLAVLGTIVGLSALSGKAEETHVERFEWRVVILVIGSVILFSVLLPYAGLFLSIVALVIVSSLASHEFNFKVALGNAVFLALLSYLAFIKGLGLVFPVWPSFI